MDIMKYNINIMLISTLNGEKNYVNYHAKL
jgi:hypothetical protein